MVGRRGRVERSAPAGLVAQRVADCEGAVVLFSWDISPLSPAAAPDRARTLSPTERAVLAFVVAGASNREIARSRRVSERTIANQVASILRKLGASSRFELIHRHSGLR